MYSPRPLLSENPSDIVKMTFVKNVKKRMRKHVLYINLRTLPGLPGVNLFVEETEHFPHLKYSRKDNSDLRLRMALRGLSVPS